MAQKWYDKAGVQSAIVGSVIAGVFFIIVALMSNNSKRLESEIKGKDQLIQQLEAQLIPFKTIALQKYTGDENQRLVKLAQDIEKIERIYEDEKWKRAAMFSQYCSFTGGLTFGNNPVSTMMGTSMHNMGDGQYKIICGEDVVFSLEKVIQIEPTCPYPYFHIAYCFKNNNDIRWKDKALQAKEILEKTTKVKGHIPIHDYALEDVLNILNEAN